MPIIETEEDGMIKNLMKQYLAGREMSLKYACGAMKAFGMADELMERDGSVTPESINEEGRKRVTKFETLEESSGFADATVFLMDNIGKWN